MISPSFLFFFAFMAAGALTFTCRVVFVDTLVKRYTLGSRVASQWPPSSPLTIIDDVFLVDIEAYRPSTTYNIFGE